MALSAFSLGFGVWAMFAALGPFLIDWYDFSPGQVMFLAAMEPMGAMIVSIPLGIVTDKYGGRIVFSALLLLLAVVLPFGLIVNSYLAFLVMGVVLGLGGASFVVGTAHVSVWYPKSRQGTALGIFALGNVGIVLGMVLVPLLVTHVFGGPRGYGDLPSKLALGPIEGWRFIFVIFAVPTLIMAALYWAFTSEPPDRKQHTSIRQIANVYRSSKLVWIVTYLYWTSFGTLTFFAASTPTYLADRWGVDAAKAGMIYTSVLVVCVAAMRPVGGWLSDRRDPLRLLSVLFSGALVFSASLTLEISLPLQLVAIYALALTSGAAAACVMKLIATYFEEVGAVSGLAKAAGAACGFTMTSIMALSRDTTGSFVPGFVVWGFMNAAALWMALSKVGIPDRSEPIESTTIVSAPSL